MAVLFDWGTYNALSTLRNAELIGCKLTEIPPYEFSRRSRTEQYFESYRKACEGVFTTVTAHAPYYAIVSDRPDSLERSLRGLKRAVRMARIAGAEIFNLHIGGILEDREKAIDVAADSVKQLLQEAGDMYISLETTYTYHLLGSIEDIRAIIEKVGSEKVIISLQLENDFMRELGVWKDGNFIRANSEATEDFWINLFRKALELGGGFLSLRFSQVTGVYLRRFLLKKRVPLGKGYPDVRPLARALARFLVRLLEGGYKVRAHLIYTGRPETKYRDTIELYSAVMKEAVEYL
ncbi:MAG: TIM barrel protein [bacterium]|nr:TIM barrel protein [bacterium]